MHSSTRSITCCSIHHSNISSRLILTANHLLLAMFKISARRSCLNTLNTIIFLVSCVSSTCTDSTRLTKPLVANAAMTIRPPGNSSIPNFIEVNRSYWSKFAVKRSTAILPLTLFEGIIHSSSTLNPLPVLNGSRSTRSPTSLTSLLTLPLFKSSIRPVLPAPSFPTFPNGPSRIIQQTCRLPLTLLISMLPISHLLHFHLRVLYLKEVRVRPLLRVSISPSTNDYLPKTTQLHSLIPPFRPTHPLLMSAQLHYPHRASHHPQHPR